MNGNPVLWAPGTVALLAGCGTNRTADPVGIYPEPELQPGPTASPLAGNEPGLDSLVDPGVAPINPVP